MVDKFLMNIIGPGNSASDPAWKVEIFEYQILRFWECSRAYDKSSCQVLRKSTYKESVILCIK